MSDIKNIKTVGRFTIDYCKVPLRESKNNGVLGFLTFMATGYIEMREIPGIYVYIHRRSGELIEIESFALSDNPEENKNNMSRIVSKFEQVISELNKACDKKERDEKIMLSGVIHDG